MKDDVFIASLVQYGYLDQVFSRIKEELRYLPDTDKWRKVVSAANAYSRNYVEMGSEAITREAASEFIGECSKHPANIIGGLDMPEDEYGPIGTVANNEQALEIINTLKRSSPASSIGDQPQGVGLKQAAMESRAASNKLAEVNGGTDEHSGKDER